MIKTYLIDELFYSFASIISQQIDDHVFILLVQIESRDLDHRLERNRQDLRNQHENRLFLEVSFSFIESKASIDSIFADGELQNIFDGVLDGRHESFCSLPQCLTTITMNQ